MSLPLVIIWCCGIPHFSLSLLPFCESSIVYQVFQYRNIANRVQVNLSSTDLFTCKYSHRFTCRHTQTHMQMDIHARAHIPTHTLNTHSLMH